MSNRTMSLSATSRPMIMLKPRCKSPVSTVISETSSDTGSDRSAEDEEHQTTSLRKKRRLDVSTETKDIKDSIFTENSPNEKKGTSPLDCLADVASLLNETPVAPIECQFEIITPIDVSPPAQPNYSSSSASSTEHAASSPCQPNPATEARARQMTTSELLKASEVQKHRVKRLQGAFSKTLALAADLQATMNRLASAEKARAQQSVIQQSEACVPVHTDLPVAQF